jgi:DNA-directed RNA polymerase subunit L
MEIVFFATRARSQTTRLEHCCKSLQVLQMSSSGSFNPGAGLVGDERHLFVPEETNRVQLHENVFLVAEDGSTRPAPPPHSEHRDASARHASSTSGQQLTDAVTSPGGGRDQAMEEDVVRSELVKKSVDGKSGVAAGGEEEVVREAVYSLQEEDHGVGQMLRIELQKDPRVFYAGYAVPNPQEALLTIRFHCRAQDRPRDIFDAALASCIARLDALASAISQAP